MLKDDVQAELRREPFVPLRLHLTGGRTFDVPFREVAHLLGYGVLVLVGLKQGTHRAKRYDRFTFEEIERIEQRPALGKGKRRKAS
jgi:hypothetical protein